MGLEAEHVKELASLMPDEALRLELRRAIAAGERARARKEGAPALRWTRRRRSSSAETRGGARNRLGLVVKNLGLPLARSGTRRRARSATCATARAREGPPAVTVRAPRSTGGGGGGGGKAARARKKPGAPRFRPQRWAGRASAVWMRSSRAERRRCGGRSGSSRIVIAVITSVWNTNAFARAKSRGGGDSFSTMKHVTRRARFGTVRHRLSRHQKRRTCCGTKTTTRHTSARAFERSHRARLRIPRRS